MLLEHSPKKHRHYSYRSTGGGQRQDRVDWISLLGHGRGSTPVWPGAFGYLAYFGLSQKDQVNGDLAHGSGYHQQRSAPLG
jgi:hypothetical protein